jgi:CBS domain-containing protein
MDDKSVGSIPVVNDAGEPVGIVTDRDICCGAVAQGKGTDTCVSDVMSKDVLTAAPDEDVESCCNKMEEKQVRRTVVTDDAGKCCGIVAQADVAREADGKETAELVQEVSRPEKRSGCC